MHTIQSDALVRFSRSLLERIGTRPEAADQVAKSLVASDLRGHDTHGVFRIPWYLEGIEEFDWIDPGGVPSVVRETPVSAVVDGHRAFGQVVGRTAVDLAIEKAKDVGVGIVGIRDATHLGRIGEWAERAARAGCFSMFQVATQGGTQTVGPVGSADRLWSTNPMAWGVPTFDALDFPIVLDIATSQVAHGKIRTCAQENRPIPDGWTITESGDPVTDAVAFEEDGIGSILPLGGRTAGYKGYGMAVMSELFAANIGDGFVAGQQDIPRSQNIAACHVIDPSIFTTQTEVERRISAFVQLIRSANYSDDIPIGEGAKDGRGLLPGEPEYRYLRERRADGIPLADGTVETLSHLAESFGIEDEIPFE